MKLAGDTHTHTVACGHAFGTITENAAYAARQGHRFVAITEHCCSMPSAPTLWFFNNMLHSLPSMIDGIFVLKGVEANITNISGLLDMPETYLKKLDLVIASAHKQAFEFKSWTANDYTNMYCAVAANPLVDIIGHSGSVEFAHNYERVVQCYKQYDKIVEINSCTPRSRPSSVQNCREIIRLCKKHLVKVAVGSDAHTPQTVGMCDWAIAELTAQDFPEELVINANYDRFREEMLQRRGLYLPD